MTNVGIALIVIGLALVCGGLILWPRALRTEEEQKTEEEESKSARDARRDQGRRATAGDGGAEGAAGSEIRGHPNELLETLSSAHGRVATASLLI